MCPIKRTYTYKKFKNPSFTPKNPRGKNPRGTFLFLLQLVQRRFEIATQETVNTIQLFRGTKTAQGLAEAPRQ